MTNELEIKKQVEPVIHSALSIEIIDKESLQDAVDSLYKVKSVQKKVEEYWSPLNKKAYEHWKQILAKKKEMLEPLIKAEKIIKNKITAFEEWERKRAEEERRKMQAKLEEQARKERERLLKKADKIKSQELKETLIEQAEEIEAPEVHIESNTKVDGISYRTTWKAKVVNKKLFLEAALKDDNLLSFILIDEKKLNKIAQATKGQLNYQGIKFYSEKIVTTR